MQWRFSEVLTLTAALLIPMAWPTSSWAQAKLPRVGIVSIAGIQEWYEPFYRTLREQGWIDGKTIAIEFRDVGGDPSRFPEPIAELVQMKVDVLFPVGPPAVRAAFAATRDIPIVAEIARKQRLPATSMFMPFAEAGGMLAYGPEMAATAERCGALVAKILSGAKPGDLPIERPDKFEFVLNLKTAKALGVKVPDTVLVRADRLIR